MIVVRKEFLEAAKFLKPVIDKSFPKTWKRYLHVKIDGVICVLTAGSHKHGKRVTLEQPDIPIDIENPDKPQRQFEYDEFLINLASLEAFEQMCKVHKKELEKAEKNDMTLGFIDIFSHRLESYQDYVENSQPIGMMFQNLDQYFRPINKEIRSVRIDTDLLFDVVKEFNSLGNFHFGGKDGHIYISAKERRFEAFIVPTAFQTYNGKCPNYECRMEIKDSFISDRHNITIYKCCVCGSKIMKLSDYPGNIPRIELPNLLDFKTGIR